MADKPRIKVSFKAIDSGEVFPLLAAWAKDGGKLSASLDRKVAQIAIKMDDGSVVRITRNADGKASHYVNVYDNGPSDSGGSYSAPKSKTARPFDDDDMPF